MEHHAAFDRLCSDDDAVVARLCVDEIEEKIIVDALDFKENGTEIPSRVVTCATRPYAILRANNAFFQEFGLDADSSLGSSLKILHDTGTNTNVYESCLAQAGQRAEGESCVIVLQVAEGKSAAMQMNVKPITTGKDLERSMMVVSFTTAGTLKRLEEVQADLSKGARAVVKLCMPQHITHVSDEWCAQLEADKKQIVGRSLKGLNGPATDQRVVHRLMQTVSRCMPAEATFVAYCVSGTMKLVNLRCFPLQCEAGNIDHFCADVVTSPIMSLGSLKTCTSDEPMVAISIDKTKSILHANAAFRGLIDAVEGQSLSDFLNEALDGENLDAAIDNVISSISARRRNKPLLITLFDKEKKPVVAKVTLIPLLDSKFTISHMKLSLMPVDVLSFSAACAKSDDGKPKFIAMVGTEGTIKHANAEWCAMYGLESSEVLGRGLSLVQGPSSNPKALQEVMDKVSSGKTHEITTVTYHQNGTGFVTTMQATPVISDSGRLEMFLCVVQDVTAEQQTAYECPISAEQWTASECPIETEQRTGPEYPITPSGQITHINGYTQLVLYPKADPTLERCIDYLEHLRDASIVKGWKWDDDALRVNVDTRRVLKYTQKSDGCRAWTPNLLTWHAWWNRMLWVVSETSRRQKATDVERASDLDFLGGSQAMPALDDVFSTEFRQISEDDSQTSSNCASESGSSPVNEADDTDVDSTDRHLASSTTTTAARSVAPCNHTPQRLQQSVAYEVLGRLDEKLGSEKMQSPVCVIDRSGHLLYVHKMLSKVIGFSRRQTLGLCWSFLAGPDANRAEVSRLQQAFELGGKFKGAQGTGEQLSSIVQLRGSNGEVFWARILARPMMLDCMGEAMECFCVSLDNCSEVMDDAEEASLTLEADTYAYIASMELHEAQEDALDVLQEALAAISDTKPPTALQEKDRSRGLFVLPELKEEERDGDGACDLERDAMAGMPGSVLQHVNDEKVDKEVKAPLAHRSDTAPQDPSHRQVRGPKEAPCAHINVWQDEQVVAEEAKTLLSPSTIAMQAKDAEIAELKAALALKHDEHEALKREVEVERTVTAAAVSALQHCLSAQREALPASRTAPTLPTPTASSVVQSKNKISDTTAACVRDSTVDGEEKATAEMLRFVEEFGGLSVEAQRQYLRQTEAAHMFLHEQLGLELASAWTPEVISEFENHVLSGGELQSGLCLCDAAGAIVWCNDSFQRHSGFSRPDVTGCQWMSFLCGPDTDAEDIATLQKSIDSHSPGAACLYAYHEDGRPLWIQVGLQPVQLRLKGKDAVNCFVLCIDVITAIMERIMACANAPIDDNAAVRAANAVSRRQKHSIAVGCAACEALGASASSTRLAAMGSLVKKTVKRDVMENQEHETRRKSDPTASCSAQRGTSPELQPHNNKRDVYDVLLSPGKDASELLLSGLLWDLRALGLVRRWAWDSDGTLRLTIFVGVVLPHGSEISEGVRLLVDSQGASCGWRGWWNRLAAAARQHRSSIPMPQEVSASPVTVKLEVAASPVDVKVERIVQVRPEGVTIKREPGVKCHEG